MPSIWTRIGFVALLLAIVGVIWLAQRSASELHRFRSDDPSVWEPAIADFERLAREAPPSSDAVVFIGASTIRFWDSIGEDLAPIEAVARGFGGAKLADVMHFADRLIEPRPAAIVLSVGGNDLFETAGNRAAPIEQVAERAKQLFARLGELAPGVPVYYVAIRPPIRDPQGRDPSSKVNALLRQYAETTDGIAFLDANVGLYGGDGQILERYQRFDSSQLSREGYQVWSAPIRERLMHDLGKQDAGR